MPRDTVAGTQKYTAVQTWDNRTMPRLYASNHVTQHACKVEKKTFLERKEKGFIHGLHSVHTNILFGKQAI